MHLRTGLRVSSRCERFRGHSMHAGRRPFLLNGNRMGPLDNIPHADGRHSKHSDGLHEMAVSGSVKEMCTLYPVEVCVVARDGVEALCRIFDARCYECSQLIREFKEVGDGDQAHFAAGMAYMASLASVLVRCALGDERGVRPLQPEPLKDIIRKYFEYTPNGGGHEEENRSRG